MQREWCPAQAADGDSSRHADSAVGCAWQRSVAAANSDISAFRQAESVPRKVLSVPRFSAAVVASKTNKSFIPMEADAESNFRIAGWSFADTVTSMSPVFLVDAAESEQQVNLSSVAIPANQADMLLTRFARYPSVEAPQLRSVLLLPSLAGTVTVEGVLTALGYNDRLTETLTTISLSGGTTQAPPSLSRLVTDAKSLRCLGLPHCHLSPYISQLCSALAESTIEHVSLAHNDIGVDGDFAEDNAAALADLLKQNKFLLSLDLSGNGLPAGAVHDIMSALANSDTKLVPSDLPPKPDVEVIPVDELVDSELIVGSDADGDEEAYEASEEADDDDYNEADDDDGEAGASDRASDRDDLDGDDEEEHYEDQEDIAAAASGDSSDDEEKEERAREAYERRVARVAQQVTREEARMRRTLLRQYVREAKEPLSTLYYDIVALRAKEEEARVEAYCKRRSGWSHLQWLSLAGNNVGDRGAMGVALTLMDEVKLDGEQVHEAEDELRDGAQKILDALVSARRQNLVAEAKERASMMEAFHSLREAAERQAMYGDAGDGADDEYDAPDVVMTNMDDAPPGDGEGAQREWGEEGDEPGVEDEGIESDVTQWTLPVANTKRGMNSLRFLDLSSCLIGNRGLKHLAKSLITNRSVETLILRDNRFGKSPKEQAVPADDSATAPSGVVSLAQALCSNQILQCLDLSYCRLDAPSLRLLSEALRENQTVHTLRLEGNNVGQQNTAASNDDASCLLEILQAVCEGGVRHLSLSHNNLEPSLWQEEIETLCEASLKLESLELSDVGLTCVHVAKWLDALNDRACRLERLHMSRNAFAAAADGHVLRELLRHCPQLQELNLNDNVALGSDGLAAMLGVEGTDMPPIRCLRCCRTGLTTSVLPDGTAVLAPSVLSKLRHLDLGDVDAKSTDVFSGWSDLCKVHCQALEYLSLWAREVSMEGHLSFARELVEALPQLQYADFGVLLRFDSQQDLDDDLGCVEKMLVQRRAQNAARVPS